MQKVQIQNNEYFIQVASKEAVQSNIVKILDICRLIPEVEYSETEIMKEVKGDRVLNAKWYWSRLLFDLNNTLAAVLIVYERKAEDNEMYPLNSLYISELCVAKEYQSKGLGRYLLNDLLSRGRTEGFQVLEGKLVFSLQTNSAFWNINVQRFYESFGFVKITIKPYENRVDNVYLLK